MIIPGLTSSPDSKLNRNLTASPKIKQEIGTMIKGKKIRKSMCDGDSLQQILIKTNGDLSEPMQIVLASPVKAATSTTSYSPIAPAMNKTKSAEPTTNWINNPIIQPARSAQALALKAVARNQVNRAQQQQLQQQQQQQLQQQQQQQQTLENGWFLEKKIISVFDQVECSLSCFQEIQK